MKVTARTEFKHQGATFKEGKEYEVPEGLGVYFAAVGWVDTDDPAALAVTAPIEVKKGVVHQLEPESTEHTQSVVIDNGKG